MTPIWYMCAYKPTLQLLQLVPNIPGDLVATVGERLRELDEDDD